MPENRAVVWLVTEDADLRARVARCKPAGARLEFPSLQELVSKSAAHAGQLWLDLECGPPCEAPHAGRRVYFYSQLPPAVGGLAPGLFIRKSCSTAVFEVLWAGVVGGLGQEGRPAPHVAYGVLPGWVLGYHDLDLKSLGRRCVVDLPRRLGYCDASLYLHDVTNGTLTLAESTHTRPIDLAIPVEGDSPSLMASVARQAVALQTDDVGREWSRLGAAPPADRTYPDGACLIIPLISDGQLWGVLNLSGRDSSVAAEPDTPLDGVFAFLGRAFHHARLYDIARTEARRDSLTGLCNQRWIVEAIEREIRRAERFAATLSVLMIDVDALKAVNDRAGHAAGDCLLRHVASRISAVLRQFDGAARVGGDEFVVVLPGTGWLGAQQVARRLVDSIREDAAHFQDSPLPTTVSVGVAEWSAGWGARQLVDAADRAMYSAKQQGRDNVVCYTPPKPAESGPGSLAPAGQRPASTI